MPVFATAFEGVVVGGALVAAWNIFVDWRRGQRERSARFLTDRKEAYAALLGTSARLVEMHRTVARTEEKLEELRPLSERILAELRGVRVDADKGAILGDWKVDPSLAVGENFKVAFELLRPHLSPTEYERIRDLLDEEIARQEAIERSLSRAEKLADDEAAAEDAVAKALADVELCAGKTVRAAADRLRAAMSAGGDREGRASSIAAARERFADAARKELGGPR